MERNNRVISFLDTNKLELMKLMKTINGRSSQNFTKKKTSKLEDIEEINATLE